MRVIGIVDGVSKDRNGHPIAWVRPLFETTKSPWREIETTEFPSQGKAFWPIARDAEDDALVFFEPQANPGQRDEFRVSDAQLAHEVLDLRSLGTSEQVRLTLVGGARRNWIPPAKTLLWCRGDVFIGPIKLISERGIVTLAKAHHHQIPCFGSLDVREVRNSRGSRFVVANPALGSPSGYVDWDDDRTVIRRALEFAIARIRGSATTVPITTQQIEQAADALAKSGDASKLRLEASRLERALTIMKDLEKSDGLATELVEALRRHPGIERELTRARDAERARGRAEIENELAAQLAETAEVRQARQAMEDEVHVARAELENIKSTRESQIADVEQAFAARLEEVLQRPAAFLAEASILRAMMRTSGTDTSRRSHPPQPHPPQQRAVRCWDRSSPAIADFTELRKRFVRHSKVARVPSTLAPPIHAAFGARLVPLVAGPHALAALQAYARVVAGGRITVVNATASLVDPSDMFGKLEPHAARFVPHAAGLIDALASARQSAGFMIVVVEGLNRGPTESFFLPVLQAALGQVPAIPLMHPRAVQEDDPYRSDALLEWPSNALLSGTLVEGPTTLPVARDVWTDAVLIQTDALYTESLTSTTDEPGISEIDFGSELFALPPDGTEEPFDVFGGIPELSLHRQSSERLARCLRRFSGDRNVISSEVVKCIGVPAMAAVDDEESHTSIIERLTTVCSLSAHDIRTLIDRAKRRIA